MNAPEIQVTVVLVNYHMADEVAAAVAALRAAEPELTVQIVVVDNSQDRSELDRLQRLPSVEVVASPVNVGFGAGCNRGAALARGRFLLFMNPDVRPFPGGVSALLKAAAECPDGAVFAPRLEGSAGDLQPSVRTFYRWSTVVLRRTPLGRLPSASRPVAKHLMLDRDHDSGFDADWALGAVLLLRRDDFARLGGFDERFFLYFEDVDLCLRAWRSGRTVRYVGCARFVHGHRRRSAGWLPRREKWHHFRSMVQFHRKYRGWPQRAAASARAPRVFVNQAGGALADRAERFAAAIGGQVLAKDAGGGGRIGRGLGSIGHVLATRPRLVYVIDVGVVGVLVQLAGRVVAARVILDTGDEYHALMRRTDEFRGLRLLLAGAVERLALDTADHLVVRGRGHVAALGERGYNDVSWIPDGVDVDRFAAVEPAEWRKQVGWNDRLVVASVASMQVDRRNGTAPGWELIAALASVPQARGVLVGDGPGRGLLERQAAELGLSPRIAFLGWRPPDELPSLIRTFDVCLSTQTNDAVGQARTSGKLPLFMAAGRYILASDVGEATRVLPASMRVQYRGEFDADYPERLADRLRALDADRGALAAGRDLAVRARELFDYPVLVEKLLRLVGRTGRRQSPPHPSMARNPGVDR